MKDLLLVIYMCWTPVDSAELASKHGYVLEESHRDETFIYETWKIKNKDLVVRYTHPKRGNQDLFCYSDEYYLGKEPNNNFYLGYNPDEVIT